MKKKVAFRVLFAITFGLLTGAAGVFPIDWPWWVLMILCLIAFEVVIS